MVQPSPSSPSYPTPTSPPPRESATRPGTSISAMSASTSATGEPSLLSSTQGDRLAGQPGGSHVAATEPITAVNSGSTSFNSSNQLDNGINTTSSTRGQHHTTDITSSTPFATLPAHPSASSASLNRSANLEISSPPLPDARPEQSAYSDTLTGTVAPNGPTAGASMGSPLISRAESPTTARQHESASNSGHDIAIKSDIDDDLRFDTDMDTNAYHEHVHDIKPVKSESGALDSPSATPKQRLSSPPDSTSDRYGFKSETASGSTSPKRESTVDGLSGGRVSEAGDDDEDDYVKSQSSKKIAVKSEPGTPGGGASKSRNRRRKEIESEPQFIDHLPSANEQALRSYVEIPDCTYASKALGDIAYFDADSTRCDCPHEPGGIPPCGEDSQCVNRLMQIECEMDECRCGHGCENQRFQRKQYADIDIVKTEKKGFGVRANVDLPSDAFVYEYVGEVIGPTAFSKRMKDYGASGIKHFYFMALDRDVFIDATKKGGKGRFLNHSCNPNCVVAKWTIGKKARMGIFAKRDIKANEELTFNYNVDRYGHVAQECYCGEPNCVGFIGGKTQTDIGGMDELYIDALGIADEVNALEARGTKKKKGRKLDEDFTPTLHPIQLSEVPKVSSATRQAIQNRRILVKLLARIQMTRDSMVRFALLRLHGFNLMSHILREYPDDLEIIKLDLEILSGWELKMRNKVESSGIEEGVRKCAAMEDAEISKMATELLDYWQSLELGYRIPKAVRDANDDDRKRAAEYSIESIAKRARVDDSALRVEDEAALRRPVFVRPNSSSMMVSSLSSTAAAAGGGNGRPSSPKVPAGWLRHFDDSGKPYYENLQDKTVTWTLPNVPHSDQQHQQQPRGPRNAPHQGQASPMTMMVKKPMPAPPVSVEDIIKQAQAEAKAVADREAAKLEEERRIAKEEAAAAAALRNKKRSSRDREREHRHHHHNSSSSNNNKSTSSSSIRSSSTTTGGSSERLSGKDKKVMALFSAVVVQTMSKYRDQFESDQFKKRAKEVTSLLCEKEKKHPMYDAEPYDSLSTDKASKVKAFTKDWVKKLLERKRASGSGSGGSGSGSGPRPAGHGSSHPRSNGHGHGHGQANGGDSRDREHPLAKSGTVTPSLAISPSPRTSSAGPDASSSAVQPSLSSREQQQHHHREY